MASVSATINNLRRLNQLQDEAIERLEEYERSVSGWNSSAAGLSGYINGYATELGYLRQRRLKLDMAIATMEKYAEGATSFSAVR